MEDDTERYANYEKFGILWEFSEDIPEATTVFTRPMFLILDLIREGASPLDRRIGETWIRCHLKSYVRLLEPFVLTLLDSRILWQPADKKVPYEHQSLLHGEQKEHVLIPYYVYIRPIDTATIDYMFTNLIALVNLGSSGFLRACKSHYVSNSDSLKSLIEASLGLSISGNITLYNLVTNCYYSNTFVTRWRSVYRVDVFRAVGSYISEVRKPDN